MRIIVALLALAYGTSAWTQQPHDYRTTFEAFPWESASFGMYAYNMDREEVVLDLQGARGLTPASATKLLSTAQTWYLKTTGFVTEVWIDGKVTDDGTLMGDLIISGSGDPTWAHRAPHGQDIEKIVGRIVDGLRQMGVRCINGEIVLDMANYSRAAPGAHWAHQDVANYYGGGVHAFNVFGNEYTLQLRQNTTIGQRVEVLGEIPDLDLDWHSELQTGEKGSGDQAYIYSLPANSSMLVKGTIPPGTGIFKIKGAIPAPYKVFVKYLKDNFATEKMDFLGFQIRHGQTVNEERIPVTKIRNEKMSEMIQWTLSRSDNLHAEALFSMHTEGDYPRAKVHLEKWMQNCGCHRDEFEIFDGSGLSRANYSSARCMVSILRTMENESSGYRELLPEGDNSSTSRMYTDGIPSDRVRAKTGSMSQVRSYAGYITTKKGEKVAFAFLINNYGSDVNLVYQMLNKVLLDLYSDDD